MYSSGLPLLIKGYNSDANGSNDTVPVTSATINWNNYFDSGRGNVICLDAIETARPLAFTVGTNATATISVGGIQVMSSINCADFAPFANPGNYYLTPLNQPGGQTLQLNLSGGAGNHGLQVLAYYENRFDTPEHVARLFGSKLKRRYLDTIQTITTNTKQNLSNTFTVPTGQGNVVGIQLLGYSNTGASTADLGLSLATVYINGVSIFENVVATYGANYCTRPRILPILINEGDTYYFNVDTSRVAGATNISFGVRLYFDDNNG
jgi:hypothetical protein